MVKKSPVIALAQIKYFDICKSHNIEKVKKYIRRAKKAGADIICFPETCLHKTEFLHMNHKLIKEVREECRKNSIWSIITEQMTVRGKDYNIAALIGRDGKIKGTYKKIHLYGDEVKPGRKTRVFKTDFAKIGIIICWDIAFPDLFSKMKKAGAEIVFCPAKWWYDTEAHARSSGYKHKKETEIKILESLIWARAFENMLYIALCNPVMETRFQISYSAIASPHGILKKIVNKEGLIIAKLNLREIKRLSKAYNM